MPDPPPARGSYHGAPARGSYHGAPARGSYHGEVHLDFADGPRVTKDHKKHEDTLLGPSGIRAGEDETMDEDDPWALSDITEMGKSWQGKLPILALYCRLYGNLPHKMKGAAAWFACSRLDY